MDDINNAWWPSVKKMEPLEAVRITADCLEAGSVVPPMAASIMALALRQYLAGKHDITGNLGLRPRRGGAHEVPTTVERRARRDDGIKRLYDAQDGCKTARAQRVADLLNSPPDPNYVTEADVFSYLLNLHQEFKGELPSSMRQVLRLVNGNS